MTVEPLTQNVTHIAYKRPGYDFILGRNMADEIKYRQCVTIRLMYKIAITNSKLITSLI